MDVRRENTDVRWVGFHPLLSPNTTNASKVGAGLNALKVLHPLADLSGVKVTAKRKKSFVKIVTSSKDEATLSGVYATWSTRYSKISPAPLRQAVCRASSLYRLSR